MLVTSRYPEGVRFLYYLIAVGVCLSVTVSAQQSKPLRVVGILELPPTMRRDQGSFDLRETPTTAGRVVAVILSVEALERAEFSYETSGALVYQREHGWSLVRTSEGVAGWLAPDGAGRFHPLEELLRERLTYLTDDWDGQITPVAGGADPVRVPTDPLRRPIGYLTPVLREVHVELQPGQDPEEIRDRYRATSMRMRSSPDGRRLLEIETGVEAAAFARPDALSPVVDRFETNRPDVLLRTTNRIPQEVLVFDRSPGWLQVAIRGDDWRLEPRVWVEASSAWRFHAVRERAEQDRLSAMAWGEHRRSVRVVGFRPLGDRVWIEIEILSHSICESTEEPMVEARGWIPAHARSGALTVWFYSRGC